MAEPGTEAWIVKGQWEHIKRIFSEAIELPAEQRKSYISEACNGDPKLIDEVYSLLEAHESPSLLDNTINHLNKSILEQYSAEIEQTLFGNYRIIKKIGSGGMGSVFLAKRADGEYEQKVALKVMNNRFATQYQIDRFKSERQILATLDHKNIARLLDGGVTDNGLPYFVMEYIEGKPIDQYCMEAGLSVKETFRLFLSVCEAVHYAHQKLVIHRDLKPSNILVTQNGTVKLLDFGIAKILSRHGNQHISTQTREGLVPLTPGYSSPEQIKGKPVTTASDVYQLGLLLYSLHCGSPPFDTMDKSAGEIENLICNTTPRKPSKVLTGLFEKSQKPSLLKQSRRLRGDPDNIIMMALKKEPNQRYRSVSHLISDIENYLQNRPVEAHPYTATYRLKKLVKRRPFESFAAVLVTLLLTGYAFTITWHSQQTTLALAQAQLEAEKSEQITGFLMGLFEAGDPYESLGDTVTARVLLERGVEQAARLDDQPEVQAQMYDIVGRVYRELGEYDDARPALQTALELRQELNETDEIDLANTFYNFGIVLHHMGDYRESDRYFNRALEIYRKYPGLETREFAGSLHTHALMHTVRRQHEMAERLSREALQMRKNLLGGNHPEVASSYQALGNSLALQGKTAQARDALLHSLALYQNSYGEFHPQVAEVRVDLARVQRQTGAYSAAEANLTRALTIREQIFGNRHMETWISQKAVGDFYADFGNTGQAEEQYMNLLEMIQTEHDTHPLMRPVLQSLGRLYLNNKKYEQAEPYLAETYEMLRSVLNPLNPRVLSARLDLGKCFFYLDKMTEAEDLLHQNAIAFSELSNGNIEPIKKETLKSLVSLHHSQGDSASADVYQSQLAQLD